MDRNELTLEKEAAKVTLNKRVEKQVEKQENIAQKVQNQVFEQNVFLDDSYTPKTTQQQDAIQNYSEDFNSNEKQCIFDIEKGFQDNKFHIDQIYETKKM